MLLPLLLAAITDPPKTPGLAALNDLAGCWQVSGEVRGKDATSVARGEWHLGGRYFVLHLRATAGKPYEAAISYGAGEQPEAIGSFWMDTFGGLYQPSLGLGGISAGGFTQTYQFPDALYVNRFERQGKDWHWTIIEQSSAKPDKLFANYRFKPARCDGMHFDF